LPGRNHSDKLVSTASVQMPQAAPVPLHRIGHITAQFGDAFGDAFGDDRGVLEVRTVTSEVLFLPARVHQHRVHAHQLQSAGAGTVEQRLPAMSGRLASQHNTGITGLRRNRFGPVKDVVDDPRVAGEHTPAQHHRIVVGDDSRLFCRRQIDRHHGEIPAYDRQQPGQPLIPPTITTRKRPAMGHNILLGSSWTRTRIRTRPTSRCGAMNPGSTSTGSY
jgi:hypothetical protein